jgi:hypothetical protein
MYPTALFGLLMVVASLAYAFKPEKRFVPLQISLGILTLSAGSLGTITGLIKSLLGLHGVEESRRWIWMLGLGETLNNMALAFAMVVLAVLVASVGALRIALRSAEVR